MAFFEQIGKKLSDAGQGAAQQAKNFADVTRLNSTISEKEKRIAQVYAEIGQAYYERHKNDRNLQAEEAERIKEINTLNAEILQCQESVKQIRGVTKCPSCGADVPANAAFCNACGTKISSEEKEKSSPAPADELICPKCHKLVPAENLFCNHCGTKIEQSVSQFE